VTKSTVLKPLIQNWYNQQKQVESEDMLVKAIINRIKNQRKIEKANNPNMDIIVFKDSVKTELQGKGVLDKYIVQILEEIK